MFSDKVTFKMFIKLTINIKPRKCWP